MRLEDIDWGLLWREAQAESPSGASDDRTEEARWDRIAPRFRRLMDVDDYPAKLLPHVKLRRGWSVLDVGCGTGAIAIPAAKKAARVTALDLSREMLRILEQDARKQGVSNVRTLHRSWDDVRVGADLEPHDVVVASRAIGRTQDLRAALEKIDSAATRYVYLTAWGGGERSHHKGVREALGKPYRDVPEYVYIFNMLQAMGIRPNVVQLRCRSRLIYSDLDEAMESCKLSVGPMSEEEERVARDYMDRTLTRHMDGKREVPDNWPVWSLIWWKKR